MDAIPIPAERGARVAPSPYTFAIDTALMQ